MTVTPPSHGPRAQARPSLLARPLMWLVRAYQLLVSPLLPPSCRFTPSCSAYAMDALAARGPLEGTWLTVRRLGRCHPWNPGGYDPVPGLEDPEIMRILGRTAPGAGGALAPGAPTPDAPTLTDTSRRASPGTTER